MVVLPYFVLRYTGGFSPIGDDSPGRGKGNADPCRKNMYFLQDRMGPVLIES